MKNSCQRIKAYGGGICVSLVIALFLLSGCGPTYSSGSRVSTRIGVSASYSELNEWGGWGVHARFGDVWYPYTEPGWAPFTYGNWVWTDRGWLWSSYEPYGWLVFHYGNWYFDDEYGWFWIPGNAWSPARVNWYVYDDYVCWAPTPPRGVIWRAPWETNVTVVWTTVEKKYFLQENIGRHKVAIRPPSKSGERYVVRHSPDAKVLVEVSNQKFEKIKVQREKVQMGGKTFYKSNLSNMEKEKVVKYRGEFKKSDKPKQVPQNKDEEKKKKKGGKP